MRKIFNLIVWTSSLSILLLSCSKNETDNDKKPNDDSNMVTVSLGMTGDILEVEETPLSKATETADIFGVQIYSSPKDENNYQPYGYGIFIDKSKMQVKLFKDRKYKFEMTVFPNGEYENREVCTGYHIPFNKPIITDSICYNNYEYMSLANNHVYNSKTGNSERFIDRYYGGLTDYIPTENSITNIDMKRVVAGLTFNIKGLTEQSVLKIEIEDASDIKIKGDGITDEVVYNSLVILQGEISDNSSLAYYTDKWFENPIDEVPFKFTWTNGERTESFTQTITLKRKMNYTFKITIPETFLVSNGITITEEDKTWDDDVTVDNIYFGNLTIENEKDLQAFKEANYTKVTGDLIFKYWNKDICTGSNTLCSVGGNLKFIASTFENGFTDVTDLAFSKLAEIKGSFELISEADRQFWGMNDFTGFSSLKSIGSDLRIKNYMASFINLSDLRGLTNLKKVSRDIEINGDNDMREFQSLAGLNENVKIGGDIKLTNLSVLKNYCDLKTVLQNHTGQFIVSGNAYNPTKEQILAGECFMQ